MQGGAPKTEGVDTKINHEVKEEMSLVMRCDEMEEKGTQVRNKGGETES